MRTFLDTIVQTGNGFKFTNRFAQSNRDCVTLFDKTAADLGIRHKLIRPYTPRYNGDVERSHCEDQFSAIVGGLTSCPIRFL